MISTNLLTEEYLNEIILDVEQQLKENQNDFGEPQAFIELRNERCVEITLESEGLPENLYYYSFMLCCSESEFDNGAFESTNGTIDRYVSDGISDFDLKYNLFAIIKLSDSIKC